MTSTPLHMTSDSRDRHFGGREGLSLEFKESREALPRNTLETICAFHGANRPDCRVRRVTGFGLPPGD